MNKVTRIAGPRLLLLAALAFGLLIYVSSAAAAPQAQAGPVLLIKPGALLTIHLRGFCLDPGKPFPDTVLLPSELADASLQAGLNYALQRGYSESEPRPVQQAIWRLSTGQWQTTPPTDRAPESVDAAQKAANQPITPGGAVSLVDAVISNTVSAQVSFAPDPNSTDDGALYGEGDIVVSNNTQQELKIFMPVGVIFPPANKTQQRLVAYQTGVLQAPTPATTGTTTNMATSIAAPTGTATSGPATTSPALTRTPAPQNTPTTTTSQPVPNIPRTGAAPGLLVTLFCIAVATLAVGLALLRRSYAK